MRAYLGLVAIACAAVGCTDEMPGTAVTTSALTKHCPNPEDCPVSNGGGTFTEELGNANVGPNDFMFVNFIDLGSSVAFIGRGQKVNGSGNYTYREGRIEYARYPGTTNHRTVFNVSETNTLPTFRISSPNGPIDVTGTNLASLELIVSLDDHNYTLSFSVTNGQEMQWVQGPTTAGIYAFGMRWNAGETVTANAQTYCNRAPDPMTGAYGGDDRVVFQGGISVNPLTAESSRVNGAVTLSCQYGAIAQARLWGYVYKGSGAQDVMFESAMHMKRASYCGDDSFFTRRNTDIYIWDKVGNLQNPQAHDDATIEAVWGIGQEGINRALCVSFVNRRKPYALYQGDAFDRSCNGTVSPPIPQCNVPAYELNSIMLADAPHAPSTSPKAEHPSRAATTRPAPPAASPASRTPSPATRPTAPSTTRW